MIASKHSIDAHRYGKHADAHVPANATGDGATGDDIPAVSYLRRSTDKQEQSLTDQRKWISEYADEHGYAIIGEYADDAISGTSARTRPAFQKMIADAEQHKFEAIIVWNSDRFSRGDLSETEYYRYRLREAGVRIVSVTEDYISRESFDGDILRVVKQHQNRQFSVNLSQNTLRGQISSVLRASDPGRMAPYGYDREIRNPDGSLVYRVRFLEGGNRETLNANNERIGFYPRGQSLRKPGKQCTAHLVLSSDDRVQTVRDIFQLCIDGLGFKGIADAFNRRGVPSPGGNAWSFSGIKSMLANPVYRGDTVWNRRTDSKFYEVKNGRVDSIKPSKQAGRLKFMHEDDWIVLENTVPAIVDRATWDRAQAAASRRAEHATGTGKQTNRWLLSGVMRCATCKQRFTGERKHKGKSCGVKRIITPYYVCGGRQRLGKSVCPHPSHVKADLLEAWVLDRLQEAILKDLREHDVLNTFSERVSTSSSRHHDARRLERDIAQLDTQITALIAGVDPANVRLINTRLTQMRTRRERLEEQLRLAQAADAHFTGDNARRWAVEQLKIFAEVVRGRRDEKARQVLACFVDEIVIDAAAKTGTLVINPNALGLFPTEPGDDGPDDGDGLDGPPGGDDGGCGPTSDPGDNPSDCTNSPTAADKDGGGSTTDHRAGHRAGRLRLPKDLQNTAKDARSRLEETPGAGFEPATSALGKPCSIQLSYPGSRLILRSSAAPKKRHAASIIPPHDGRCANFLASSNTPR